MPRIGEPGAGSHPRRVNKTPPRKTVPISAVGIRGVAQSRPAPPPHRTFLAPKPAPRPASPSIIRASRKFGLGLSPAQTIAQGQRHHRNAEARAAHRAARADVLHSLGLGPARTIRSVGFSPSPVMRIGDQRNLRDSGVANNYAPTFRGQSLSPQRIRQAAARVVAPGHSLAKQRDIALLHAAGVSDPLGSTTPLEHARQAHAVRERIVRAFVKRYKDLSKLDYGKIDPGQFVKGGSLWKSGPLTEAQVRQRIAHATNDQLIHALQTYQPGGLAGARRVQTEGLSLDPRVLADALSTGLGAVGAGIHAITGNSVVGNALSDAAFLPIGAVGAIATGAAHPGETLKALESGAIGHAAAGDWKGALKVAHDHPLFTAFELQGAKAVLGRGAGAALRAIPGRDFAGLARDPVALIGEKGTRAIYERGYSKDVFNQFGQRAFDRRLPQGPSVELRGKQVPSRLMRANRGGKAGDAVAGKVHRQLVNRFVDVFVSRVNSLNRQQREENARYARAHAPVRQHGGKDVRNLQARLHAAMVARGEFAAYAARLSTDATKDAVRRHPKQAEENIRHPPNAGQAKALKIEQQAIFNDPKYIRLLNQDTPMSAADNAYFSVRHQRAAEISRELSPPTVKEPVLADQKASAATAAAVALHLMDQHLASLADLLDGSRRGVVGRARQRVGEAVDRSLPSQPLTKTGERVAGRFPGLYRPERDVVSHSLQGLIRNNPNIRSAGTLREDLVAEQSRLMHAAADVENPRREMAQQQAQFIQRVLENPKAMANAEGIFRSGSHLSARLNEQERNNVRLGLAAGAADRTKLFPFAQSHMGAEYGGAVKGQTHQEAIAARRGFRQTQRDVGKEMAALKERERYLMGLRDGTIKETQRVVSGGRVVRYGPHFRADEVKTELAQVRGHIQTLRDTRGERVGAARDAAQAAARRDAGTPAEQLHSSVGERLSNVDIRAAMRDHGINPDEVAYLHHLENQMGPTHDRAAYYKRFDGNSRENVAGSQKRTGELFKQGGTAYDYNTIIDQMVRHGTKAINAQQLDKLVHDIGIRNPDGTYLTAAEFKRLQVRMKAAGTPVEAIVGHQQRLSAEARAAIKEEQNPVRVSPQGGMLGEMTDAMTTAGATSARRNIVAVPSTFMDRLREHIATTGDPIGGRAFSSAFRKTVLPFSTKWMVGNVAEGVLRAIGTAGAIPIHDNLIAKRALLNILKEDAKASGGADGLAAVQRYEAATNRAGRRAAKRDMERHAPNAQAAKAELLGMLFYGNKGLTSKARVGSGTLGEHPAVHALSKSVDALTAPSFALNRRLEHALQTMTLGKHLRQQIHEFTGSWVKSITAQKQALEDASRGLVDTSGQVRAAKMMDDVLGRYSRFSPKTRAIIQTVAPFLPWYLNAMRFTLVTLPLHNPIKTAVLTAVERQFQTDWTDQHKDIKTPGELNTAVKQRDGGYLDLARYTPFGFPGAVAAGDYGQVVSPILPQIQGLEKAFEGQDPFGQPLQTRGSDGKMRPLTKAEQRAYILNTAVEETVPLVSIARRIMEGGATALPTSTIFGTHTKPGSAHGSTGLLGGLDRAFNPLRPIYLRNNAQTGPIGIIEPAHSAGKPSVQDRINHALSKASGGAAASDDLNRRINEALRAAGR